MADEYTVTKAQYTVTKASPYASASDDPSQVGLGKAVESFDRGIYDAGGAVTDLASKAGLPPQAAGAAGYVANVGLQALPMFLGGEAVKPVAPLLEAGGKRLMQSALKPTLDNLKNGNAAKAITTMLDNGFNATAGGVEKMRSQIADLGDQITQAVQNSTAQIDKNAVADRLRTLLDRVSKQVNPNADIAAVQKAWTEFLNHPALAGRPTMSVQEAQALKQGTYRELGTKAYGELGSADIEAQKGLARGLKEEISTAVPEVSGMNARQGELLNAAGIADRRVLMNGNNNTFGIGLLNPETLIASLLDRSPLAKSLLARGLYKGSETIPASTARAGIGLAEYADQKNTLGLTPENYERLKNFQVKRGINVQ